MQLFILKFQLPTKHLIASGNEASLDSTSIIPASSSTQLVTNLIDCAFEIPAWTGAVLRLDVKFIGQHIRCFSIRCGGSCSLTVIHY